VFICVNSWFFPFHCLRLFVAVLRRPCGRPEAAVDEDDGLVFREDDVRLAGEVFVFRAVDGEAVGEAVQEGAHGELGLRVAAADSAHVP